MRLLALETSTQRCSVALAIDGYVTELDEERGHGQAERILPMVAALLERAGLALADLDAIAFGRGPGAFTGLRIAVSVAQGLGYGARKPLVPVSGLAAVALQARRQAAPARPAAVRVSLDARMQQVYWATYEVAEGLVPRLLDQEVVTAPVFGSVLAGAAILAPGRDVAESFLPDLQPRAREVAAIGQLAYAAGVRVAPADARPVYVRDNVVGGVQEGTVPGSVPSST